MLRGNILTVGVAVLVTVVGGQHGHYEYDQGYVETPYSQPSGYSRPEPQQYYTRPTYTRQPRPHHQSYESSYPSSSGSAYPRPYQRPRPSYPQQQQQQYPSSHGEQPHYAAMCDFGTGAGSGKVQGRLTLTQGSSYEPVIISGKWICSGGETNFLSNPSIDSAGTISPLKPGQHGFHIHMYGDFSDGCTSAGGHYNPLKADHGSPDNNKKDRHIGDLGNIEAGYDSTANIHVVDKLVSLADGGKYPIGGRAIVVHEKPDDLGRGGDAESKKTGNAGARLGCCIITYIDPKKLH
ncbi:unnamed protein product [Notodromas monacha]|uniref:Superoxide dismutase [Cu-Zn] n=1 Tax=Notodromas monacha TaxID=399045 RepID=A0A7R9BJX7_9CRUS|nr:unnamed protein product [Notodromas monacha]CAG0915344.1 unnamed protein product [Notodromas monacha]